jgi:hypothetical protein
MRENAPDRSQQSGYVNALLEGGPADIPAAERQRRVSAGDGKVKLLHRGGYEHFECTGELSDGQEDQPQSIYRWVTRTCIAE